MGRLTQSYLKSILKYDKSTGVFTRLVSRGRFKAGTHPGCVTEFGYLRIDLDGRSYMAHHLAWLYVKGELPDFEIDHINRDKLDNSWKNLRKASRLKNNWNQGLRKDNVTGYKGVSKRKDKNKWRAVIVKEGKQYCIGDFNSPEEAAEAYNKKAIELFGEFAFTNHLRY